MRFKRLLALLLAAALALSLLAGCGGGKNQSLSQMLLNLLDGQYQNVSVEIDSDLEAKLRQAISQSETDEELRAALEQLLGGGISFQRLGSGQQGDSAWTLILYPGTDPDAAARSVYLDLDKVFAALPDDGVYSSGFAMVEMENGYAILVRATVDKAGTEDKPDPVTLESIKVTKNPKLEYWVGESFNPAGMEITATYSNNTTKTLKDIEKNGDQGVKWTPAGALATSDTSVTITYGEKNTTVSVTVKEPEVEKIEVTKQPNQIEYNIGASFNPTGMVITATYSDNVKQETIDSNYKNKGVTWEPETIEANTTQVIISYKGKTATVPITVTQPALTGITVTGPNKTTYEIGETFDSTGMVVTANYSYGAPKQLSSNEYQLTLTDSNDSSFNLSTPFTTVGTYTLMVEYNKIKSDPITITVEHKGYIYDKSSNTYYVSNENGLMAWNEAAQIDLSINCTLTADINLTGKKWTPIGYGATSEYGYQGTFDGQGHRITGLAIISDDPHGENAALFDGIGGNGEVKNLQLVDVKLNESGGATAGIVVNNYGTIMACSMTGEISAYSYTSGIANSNLGKIVACWFSGTLKENEGYGIVAFNYGTITACFWDGNTTNGYRSNEGETVEATKVEGSTVTWQDAVDGMNEALTDNDYKWVLTAGNPLPTLKK